MRAVLRFDGGSRGNPGPSACAYLIEFAGERVLKGDYLGKATNNYAEWMGLVKGLEEAVKLLPSGDSHLEIYADSELVVKQVTGEYKMKSASLSPLRMSAMNMLSMFKSFKIEHVRREKNKECDAKVNEILDNSKE